MGGWNKNGKGGGNQQRFQKFRTDTVVPGTTGVLVSCDPAGTGKAIRELKLLLEPFKPLAAIEAEKAAAAAEAAEEAAAKNESADASAAPAPSSSAGGFGGAFSLAAELAAELESFRRPIKPDAVVTTMTAEGAAAAGDDNDADGAKKKPDGPRKPKRMFRQEWFSSLETNCKGYVLMNIPKPIGSGNNNSTAAVGEKTEREEAEEANTTATAETEESSAEPAAKQLRAEGEDGTTLTSSTAATAVATTNSNGYNTDTRFRSNPYVTEVVESLMESLSANPRPVTRFSYRLIPVEASCNPTLPCILACAKELCDTLEVPSGRGLIRIGVVFAVKNNTTVQKEKNYMKAAIEASLPKTKFVVFGYWNTNWARAEEGAANNDNNNSAVKHLIEVDAILHVFVAHSTCCMGLQRHMTGAEGRRMYNLHDFGAGTLSLGEMAKKDEGEAAPTTAEQQEEKAEAVADAVEAPTATAEEPTA